MRKEAFCVARGAALDDFNVFPIDPGCPKLPNVGLDQIEMKFRCRITVPGRTLVQKKQRISDMQRIGVKNLVKKLAGVAELRFKFGAYFLSHNVAAAANAWPNSGAKVNRITVKMPAHLADALFENPRYRSSPAGVKDADGSCLRINYKNRNTVRSLDGEQHSRRLSDDAVARNRRLRRVDAAHDGGVNLFELDQRPGRAVRPSGSELSGEEGAISTHVFLVIVRSESEIERCFAVAGGNAALASAEAMDQPGKISEELGAENLDAGRRILELLRRGSILQLFPSGLSRHAVVRSYPSRECSGGYNPELEGRYLVEPWASARGKEFRSLRRAAERRHSPCREHSVVPRSAAPTVFIAEGRLADAHG